MRTLIPLSLIALLAGCAVPAPSRPTSSMPLASDEDTEVERLVGRLHEAFDGVASSRDLSGIVRIEHEGAVRIVRFGLADVATGRPHETTTLYSMASVTKGITAATIVALARRGSLSLEDPVGQWLPELAQTSFTIEDVLHHRAGLPRDLPDEDAAVPNVAAWLAADPARLGAVGEENYSNIGYQLMAEVIAAASGAPFEDTAQRLVIDPAGMTMARLSALEAHALPGGAKAYTPGPAPLLLADAPLSPPMPGATGLVGTVGDLARWVDVLASDAYPELFDPDDPLGSIDAREDASGSYLSVQGTLPGYGAQAIVWPGRRTSIAFAGNLFSYPMLSLGSTLRSIVGDGPVAPPPARRPEIAPTPAHRAWIGSYMHRDFGAMHIRETAAGVQLRFPRQPSYWTFHLTPIADGTLQWRAFGREFTVDAEGKRMLAPLDDPSDASPLEPLD
ncbi:serine hydrolase domain-containing protein [Sphingomicrobium sp. XHP0235]|uniref:serine hydrolase domain-containing protein n=1 Tax=Sphingomicrobium aquimarinum TaxID=3133971 RepID=UPI0031FEE20E